jgi:hypothetical protein
MRPAESTACAARGVSPAPSAGVPSVGSASRRYCKGWLSMTSVHGQVNGKPEMGEPGNESENRPAGEDSQSTAGQRQPSPLDPLLMDLAELAASAAHYASARRDLFVSRTRDAVLWLTVFLGVACVSLAVGATAVVLMLQGIALALTEVLGMSRWASQLLTGAVALIGLIVAGGVVLEGWNRNWHRRITAKYEHYKQRERAAIERNARRTAKRD